MKRIKILALVGCVLMLSSCSVIEDLFGKSEEPGEEVLDVDMSDEWGVPVDGNQEQHEATLYTVKEAFEKAFAFYGDNAEVVNKGLEPYGLTIETIPQALTGELNVNPNIASLLSNVGISNEEVDWTTYNTYNNIQLIAEAVQIPTEVFVDRDDFVAFLDGVDSVNGTKYDRLNKYKYLSSEATAATLPDYGIIEEMLSKDFNPETWIESYSEQLCFYDANGCFIRKVNDGGYPYYKLTLYEGIPYVTYYPVFEHHKSVSVDKDTSYEYAIYDLNELSEHYQAPLWQCYFEYYVQSVISNYKLTAENPCFIDRTDVGLEMWFVPTQGKSVKVNSYENGYISITVAYDHRQEDYSNVQGNSPHTENSYYTNKANWYAILTGGVYNQLTPEQFDDIIYYAKQLNLPLLGTLNYADDTSYSADDSEQWQMLTGRYLETIGTWKETKEVTISKYLQALISMAEIGQTDEVKGKLSDLLEVTLVKYTDIDSDAKTFFVNHPEYAVDIQQYFKELSEAVINPEMDIDTTWLFEIPHVDVQEDTTETTAEEEIPIVVEEENPGVSNEW